MQQLVLWAKLFRRLVSYFQSGYTGLSQFDEWLRADIINRDNRLLLPTLELGNMHDLMHIEGNTIKLKYLPEDVVIVPDDYVLPIPVPEPVPVPITKGAVKIIAALINASEKEETGFETVTILNTTNNSIDLNGWFIADTTNQEALSETLDKGEALRIHLKGKVRLSNTRDTLTILDNNKKIIDQITYEAKQLPAEGFTMIF